MYFKGSLESPLVRRNFSDYAQRAEHILMPLGTERTLPTIPFILLLINSPPFFPV